MLEFVFLLFDPPMGVGDGGLGGGNEDLRLVDVLHLATPPCSRDVVSASELVRLM